MPYRISYLKPRLLIQPQSNRMKSLNQTEIPYQLSNLGKYLYLINEQFAYICCC